MLLENITFNAGKPVMIMRDCQYDTEIKRECGRMSFRRQESVRFVFYIFKAGKN